jgi:hypothetical protein
MICGMLLVVDLSAFNEIEMMMIRNVTKNRLGSSINSIEERKKAQIDLSSCKNQQISASEKKDDLFTGVCRESGMIDLRQITLRLGFIIHSSVDGTS